VEVRARVLEEAESLGLPPYAPVELHVVGPKGFERYKRGTVVELRRPCFEAEPEELGEASRKGPGATRSQGMRRAR
jgi:hypothetical protein